jgi:hypothetical protein
MTWWRLSRSIRTRCSARSWWPAPIPLELVQAYQWLQRNPGLNGPARTQAAQEQNWDPSVQALVVFPDVLKRLNDDITWTTNLGNAFLAQQQDVMDAVQRMRQRAQEAGKLASTPQENVVTRTDSGPPVIEIVPADPAVIYVPVYDPVWIWGPPLWYPCPGWYWPPRSVIVGVVGFGFGIGIDVGFLFWRRMAWMGRVGMASRLARPYGHRQQHVYPSVQLQFHPYHQHAWERRMATRPRAPRGSALCAPGAEQPVPRQRAAGRGAALDPGSFAQCAVRSVGTLRQPRDSSEHPAPTVQPWRVRRHGTRLNSHNARRTRLFKFGRVKKLFGAQGSSSAARRWGGEGWGAMSIMNSLILPASLATLAMWLSLLEAAPQESQKTFSTPEAAAQALVDATEQNDTAALLKLFGPGGKDIVQSGDAADDKTARAEFAVRARARLQVEPDHDNPNRAILVVGDQIWPLPVPLIRKNGQWYFDAPSGRIEILALRVGRNELTALDVCRAYVEAQMEYASRDRDAHGMLKYAQQIVSSPGKKDGLYYEDEPENLVPKSFADAAAVLLQAQGKKPVPYHGYFFHILKSQGPDAQGGAMNYVVKGAMIGGFALVAWPAEYGVSGVRTLIVNHGGIVYEKGLGPQTATLARQMTQFNPDKTWRPVLGE